MNIEKRIEVLEELLTDICPKCFGSGDSVGCGPAYCCTCNGKGRTLKKQIEYLFNNGNRDNY